LLRHYELESARAVLAGQAGDELSQAPLTFFVSLSQYRPEQPGDPLPRPQDWLVAQWVIRYPHLPGFEACLQERRLTLLLATLRLTLHPEAQVTPVTQGIPWLGFLVYPDHRRVKTRNVRQFQHRLQAHWQAYCGRMIACLFGTAGGHAGGKRRVV
jgi:hypothetical protein